MQRRRINNPPITQKTIRITGIGSEVGNVQGEHILLLQQRRQS